MRCLVFFFLLTTTAFAHPCKTGNHIQGTLDDGNALGFRLQGDERKFRLVNLRYDNPVGLDRLFVAESNIQLFAVSEKADRYGRYSAQAFVESQWVQGKALSSGLALFDGRRLRDDCALAMKGAEKIAEAAKAGLWAGESALQVDNTERILRRLGQFSLVEGTILGIGDRKSRVYLNFGQKWSEDMTGLLRRKGRDAYQGDWSNVLNLKGKRVRLRGVIEESGGPMIRIFDEAQIGVND